MNFHVSELPYGLLGVSNNYSLPGEFDVQESNRRYVPELPKNVPRDSRGRLPPELMYDIIYEAFTDSVHTMISAISGEEFTVGRKMLSTITNGYKFEQSFIRRISSVSHVFRAILKKLLSEVFELGGILLDPAKAYVHVLSNYPPEITHLCVTFQSKVLFHSPPTLCLSDPLLLLFRRECHPKRGFPPNVQATSRSE